MPNPNLKPYEFTSDQSRTKAAENGRKGGIASGEAKRRKKAMREVLEDLLALPLNEEQAPEEVKSFLDFSKKRNVTIEQAVLMAQIVKAITKGDTKAAAFLRDTAGQKILRDAADNNAEYEDDGFTEAIKASAKGVWDECQQD